ncbi:hypothetical protein C8Q75DRAFT_774283 [Abortiporus biennis]|nr:hypothetical protein C8Q75DRAFT_774283 [Abortiporus biennis]
MSSRADDYSSYNRGRSRSRERSYRDDRRDRSRDNKPRERGDDKGSDKYDRRRRSPSPVVRGRSHSKSRSPRRRYSRSRSWSRDRDREGERKRRRSHSREEDYERSAKRKDRSSRERRRRSRSRSSSVSSSSSTSTDHKRHRRKKDKHKRKRSKSRDREKKERKKEKKEKKKKKAGAIGHQWGKYGIINETDIYNKEQEFRAWLVEERKINPETITKDQNKKEFAKFVEDFNTATLPHEKFYDMTSYERRMDALRSGAFVPPTDDGYDPNADLLALQSKHKRKPTEQDTYMTKEQLMELRRVQAERIEAGKMKLLGMDVKQNMGVRMDGSMFDG